MDYRASIPEIVEYIEEYTKENFSKYYPEAKKVVEVALDERGVRSKISHHTDIGSHSMDNELFWKELLGDREVSYMKDLRNEDLLRLMCNNEGSLLDIMVKNVTEDPNKFILSALYSQPSRMYGFFRLTNGTGGGWGNIKDSRCTLSFYLKLCIQEGGLVAPKIDLFFENYSPAGGYKEEVREIELVRNPMKLGRWLRSVGFTEYEVTNLSKHVSFKPKQFEMFITDHYIPECYIQLSEDQNLDSCMSKTSGCYELESDEHPTMAYEDSDCLLLLIKDCSSNKEFPYVARSIGSKLNSGYVNKYGLEIISFTDFDIHYEDLLDHELSYNTTCNGDVLLPYLDSCTNFVSIDHSKESVIIDGGSYYGCIDSGVGVKSTTECDNCGEEVEREDIYWVDGVGDCCYDCYCNSDDD